MEVSLREMIGKGLLLYLLVLTGVSTYSMVKVYYGPLTTFDEL